MNIRATADALLSLDYCGLALAILMGCAGALLYEAVPSPASELALILMVVAAPLAAGGSLQLGMSAWSRWRYPPLGRLIDVGGYRLQVMAEGEGGPPVVWIPGSHDQGLAFHHLHRQWRLRGRSILFDRAASGGSDTGPFPRSLPREVAELEAALRGAGETGPFVLVAHSLGGLLAQNFADRYPEQVAGLVLLDSACPDAAIYTRGLPGNRIPGAGLGRWLATAFGLGWLIIARMSGDARRWLDVYDADIRPRIVQGICRPRLVIGFRSALASVFSHPLDMVKGQGALGNVPLLAVIPPALEDAQRAEARRMLPWASDAEVRNFVRLRTDAQHQTARLSSRGELRISPAGTTHGFPYEAPEFTLGLVREMVESIGSGRKPAGTRDGGTSSGLAGDLARCIARHHIPGAVIAVLRGGQIDEAAAGVLSRESGAAATPDSLFHIGSVSKLFTATLVMQMVERGVIALDAPFADTVPAFALADGAAARVITTRQLLCHTSGIPGDFFRDTGDGPDKLERYVEACAELHPAFPAGDRFSYCNAGYSLLGRQIELLSGVCWEQALAERLMQPLGLRRWAVRPEVELRFLSAVGHMTDPVSGAQAVALPGPASLGPGGSRLALSARELLTFVQLFINDGRGASGQSLLGPDTVAAMLKPQVELPFSSRIAAWGLGWTLFDYGGKRVIGHDGGTAGMTAQLRILPEQGLAIAVMSNGGDGGAVFRELAGAILAGHGAPLPEGLPGRPELAFDPSPFTGTYRRYGMEVTVDVIDGALSALVRSRDGELNVPAPTRFRLTPVDGRTFRVDMPGATAAWDVHFTAFDSQGRPQFLYSLERALRRIEAEN